MVDRYSILTWNPRWAIFVSADPHSADEELDKDGDYCHWDDVEPIIKAATNLLNGLKSGEDVSNLIEELEEELNV